MEGLARSFSAKTGTAKARSKCRGDSGHVRAKTEADHFFDHAYRNGAWMTGFGVRNYHFLLADFLPACGPWKERGVEFSFDKQDRYAVAIGFGWVERIALPSPVDHLRGESDSVVEDGDTVAQSEVGPSGRAERGGELPVSVRANFAIGTDGGQVRELCAMEDPALQGCG